MDIRKEDNYLWLSTELGSKVRRRGEARCVAVAMACERKPGYGGNGIACADISMMKTPSRSPILLNPDDIGMNGFHPARP